MNEGREEMERYEINLSAGEGLEEWNRYVFTGNRFEVERRGGKSDR